MNLAKKYQCVNIDFHLCKKPFVYYTQEQFFIFHRTLCRHSFRTLDGEPARSQSLTRRF